VEKKTRLLSKLRRKEKRQGREPPLLDTIHRGGSAFIVALGVDVDGEKHPLGFW
jgi:hypothetical protein